jgi:hypothetical protein
MVLQGEESLTEFERKCQHDFLDMKFMVEELYMEQGKNRESPSQVKDEDDSGEPSQTPPPPSNSSSPPPYQKGELEKINAKLTLLKLDVKIDFSMYNSELNVDKLHN